jgi:hypothetical protein
MMTFRCLIALLALTAAVIDSEAGPLRRRAQPTYQYPSYQYPSYQQPTYEQPGYQQPLLMPASGSVTNSGPVVTAGSTGVVIDQPAGAGDGLDEVNAKRAARGLRPYIRDEALTQAAMGCASFRAQHGLFGHTSNDFAFVPSGASAASAGCAAYPASYGWMSCCVYEGYTYAGAAWVTGRDGRRYMHLFVR